MKVNIAQAIKRIKKSPDFFRPLYESIINSIQADADIIKIKFQLEEHGGEGSIYNIVSYSIEDNGHGFTDEDADAFLTLYTERNADKGALGSGRILCLKVFDDIFITSQTKNNGQELGKETKINFNVNFNYNSIDELTREEKSSDKSYTITEYKNLKQAYQNKEFNLDQIKENIFTELLPLFIEYSTNDKNLTIFIDDQEWINKKLISSKMLSYNFKEKVFSVSSNDSSITKVFKLYYRIENDDARKKIFEEFKEMIRTETVVGQPIYLDDATIVPFVDISFGFGTGNHGTNGESSGEAGGGKMSPTAVLIMKGERVELFSIKNATPNGTIDRVLNMIPEAVSHFTKKKEKKNEVREAALKEAKEAMKEEAETAALEAKVQNR